MAVCTNVYQQVFCLSIEVCAASTQKGSVSDLESYLQTALETLLGNSDFNNGDDWSLVWGPVVWQAPFSQVVDQALAVLYDSSNQTFVVAIGATNPNSPFNVFYEDLAVVPFYMQPIGSGGGTVSVGNYTALQLLLSMESNGYTLQDLLTAKANDSATLVFCGHSLGGGLAPLLAWSLYPEGPVGNDWSNVYTFATAGPTVANDSFAAAFNAAYPPVVSAAGGYQRWNVNQYNARDIVPNAWAGSKTGPGIAEITWSIFSSSDAMYYTSATFGLEITALRDFASALASGGGVNPYTAVDNYALFTGAHQYGEISDAGLLGKEIVYQHTTAYLDTFGVNTLFPNYQAEASIQPLLLSVAQGLSVTAQEALPAQAPA